MSQQPAPLDYRPPRDDRAARRGSLKKLLLGMVIGASAPAAVFALSSLRLVPYGSWLSIIPFEIVAAIVLLFIAGYRPIGAGILLVIALAVLTVLGFCAVVLSH